MNEEPTKRRRRKRRTSGKTYKVLTYYKSNRVGFCAGFTSGAGGYGPKPPSKNDLSAIENRLITPEEIAKLQKAFPKKSVEWCVGFSAGADAAIDLLSKKILGERIC